MRILLLFFFCLWVTETQAHYKRRPKCDCDKLHEKIRRLEEENYKLRKQNGGHKHDNHGHHEHGHGHGNHDHHDHHGHGGHHNEKLYNSTYFPGASLVAVPNVYEIPNCKGPSSEIEMKFSVGKRFRVKGTTTRSDEYLEIVLRKNDVVGFHADFVRLTTMTRGPKDGNWVNYAKPKDRNMANPFEIDKDYVIEIVIKQGTYEVFVNGIFILTTLHYYKPEDMATFAICSHTNLEYLDIEEVALL